MNLRATDGAQTTARPSWESALQRLDEYRWLLPQDYKPGMRVPGLIFATDELLRASPAGSADIR